MTMSSWLMGEPPDTIRTECDEVSGNRLRRAPSLILQRGEGDFKRTRAYIALDLAGAIAHSQRNRFQEHRTFKWALNAESSGCRMSASPPSSTLLPAQRRRRRPIIRSAPSNRI